MEFNDVIMLVGSIAALSSIGCASYALFYSRKNLQLYWLRKTAKINKLNDPEFINDIYSTIERALSVTREFNDEYLYQLNKSSHSIIDHLQRNEIAALEQISSTAQEQLRRVQEVQERSFETYVRQLQDAGMWWEKREEYFREDVKEMEAAIKEIAVNQLALKGVVDELLANLDTPRSKD